MADSGLLRLRQRVCDSELTQINEQKTLWGLNNIQIGQTIKIKQRYFSSLNYQQLHEILIAVLFEDI